MLRISNQHGDTIVEVLIAISVIGLILTTGYATANVNLMAERQAQERSAALGVLQGQIEQLKSLSAAPATQPFCMLSNVVTYKSSKPGNSGCQFNASGNNGVTTEPFYSVDITYNSNTYTAKATWERAGGGGIEDMTLQYKLYP